MATATSLKCAYWLEWKHVDRHKCKRKFHYTYYKMGIFQADDMFSNIPPLFLRTHTHTHTCSAIRKRMGWASIPDSIQSAVRRDLLWFLRTTACTSKFVCGRRGIWPQTLQASNTALKTSPWPMFVMCFYDCFVGRDVSMIWFSRAADAENGYSIGDGCKTILSVCELYAVYVKVEERMKYR